MAHSHDSRASQSDATYSNRQSSSQPQSEQRKRPFNLFQEDLKPEGPEDNDYNSSPASKRPLRKGSIFGAFNFMKPKESTYEKLIGFIDDENNDEKPKPPTQRHPATVDLGTTTKTEGPAFEAAKEQVRRKSSLTVLKELFIRRRKDSANSDHSSVDEQDGCLLPVINDNPHQNGELRQTGIAPHNMNDCMSFGNHSYVVSGTAAAAPSAVHESGFPGHRPFTIHPRRTFRYPNPDEWFDEFPSTPTPHTNADAGVFEEPHRWFRLNGYSPSPTRRSSRRGSILQLPNLLKMSRKRKRSIGNRKRRVSPDRRATSGGVPLFDIATSASEPPGSSARGPKQHPRKLNDIGVLPAIETTSIESSSHIPMMNFSVRNTSPTPSTAPLNPSSRNGRRPTPTSSSSSMAATRSSCPYPQSNRPLLPVLVTPAMVSTLSIPLATTTSTTTITNTTTPPNLRSASNQSTARDDSADAHSSQLSRMDDLANTLARFQVNEDSTTNSDRDADTGAHNASTDNSRGRSKLRIRRR